MLQGLYAHTSAVKRRWRWALAAGLGGALWMNSLTAQEPLPRGRGAPPGAAIGPLGTPIPQDDRLLNPPPEVREKEANLLDMVIDPELVLHIHPTRSKIVRTRQPVTRVAITDPSVLEINQFGPQEFEFIGRRSGETTLTLWFTAADGLESIIRYLVRVASDQAQQERAEVEYALLQDRINELFPNSQVQLMPVADKLVLRGQARDAEEAAQILALVRGGGYGEGYGGGFVGLNPAASGPVARLPGAEDLAPMNIVNLLTVPGEQQVMLKVRIAELSRSSLRDLGVNFDALVDGDWGLSNFITQGANIAAIFDAGDYELFVKAFASNGNGKILAEPTLVTLSGYTATFIAGGEFAVPTAVGVDGVSAATTTFRGFGTQVYFTPTVLDKDRIRLHVSPSFSSLNTRNSVQGIPGLDTRAVNTTVDLREGQWLAIAGLIQDEQQGSRSRIPFIGDVPLIGALFGNQQVQRGETELVVLVSPELVHPLEQCHCPFILPGMSMTEPTNHDFWFSLQIEGDPNVHHRSTVWPQYRHQMHEAWVRARRDAHRGYKQQPAFDTHQDAYLCTPHGFSH
jgi:pilus assembly protein CpaC